MNGKELYQEVAEYVQKAEIEKALKLGYEHYPKKSVILLSNRYFTVKRSWTKGTISHEDYKIEIARISEGLIDVFANLDHEPNYKKNYLKKWEMVFLLFILPFIDYAKLKGVLITLTTLVVILVGASIYDQQNVKETATMTMLEESVDKIQDPPEDTTGGKNETDHSNDETTANRQNPVQGKQDASGEEKESLKYASKGSSSNTDDLVENQSSQNTLVNNEKSLKMAMIGKSQWISENVAIQHKSSWCYENKESNCDKYGRLYSWKEAVSICKQLGKDWHLPSDNEWQVLLNGFGGYNDPFGSDTQSNQALTFINLEKNGINIVFGGRYLYPYFNGKKEIGYYWSQSEENIQEAWSYSFHKKERMIDRLLIDKSYGLSCLCVK